MTILRRGVVGGLCALLLVSLTAPVGASAQTKLLRFPDIHGNQVVFAYGGDLWLAPAMGGTATRLTAHPGLEMFPKFSPDGRWIAFTGQYDGDEQVYVIPATGGVPQQLTFCPERGPLAPRWGYDNQVYDWTPDGSAVLFRSLRDAWDLGDSRLYTVTLDGKLPTVLPMPVSGGGDLSPDGTKAVYSPPFRDFRSSAPRARSSASCRRPTSSRKPVAEHLMADCSRGCSIPRSGAARWSVRDAIFSTPSAPWPGPIRSMSLRTGVSSRAPCR